MRARLLCLLVVAALIAGGAVPIAFAAEKRAMRNPTTVGIFTLRSKRTIVAESRFLPFRAFERSHERASQSLALCCIAAAAPPEADMIVVTEDAPSQAARPEPAPPEAPPTAKAKDEPSIETVAGVTIMRGSVTEQSNH
jgi:hypothetical protein